MIQSDVCLFVCVVCMFVWDRDRELGGKDLFQSDVCLFVCVVCMFVWSELEVESWMEAQLKDLFQSDVCLFVCVVRMFVWSGLGLCIIIIVGNNNYMDTFGSPSEKVC